MDEALKQKRIRQLNVLHGVCMTVREHHAGEPPLEVYEAEICRSAGREMPHRVVEIVGEIVAGLRAGVPFCAETFV